MRVEYFLPIVTFVSASSFCDDFLKKEIPQVVKNCGYSDIVPYCCSSRNIEILQSYSDDFKILCEDRPPMLLKHFCNFINFTKTLEVACVGRPTSYRR
jgi:hypothetical protein